MFSNDDNHSKCWRGGIDRLSVDSVHRSFRSNERNWALYTPKWLVPAHFDLQLDSPLRSVLRRESSNDRRRRWCRPPDYQNFWSFIFLTLFSKRVLFTLNSASAALIQHRTSACKSRRLFGVKRQTRRSISSKPKFVRIIQVRSIRRSKIALSKMTDWIIF